MSKLKTYEVSIDVIEHGFMTVEAVDEASAEKMALLHMSGNGSEFISNKSDIVILHAKQYN